VSLHVVALLLPRLVGVTDDDNMQLRLLEPCVSLMEQGLQASTRGATALAHMSKTLRHVLHLCTKSAAHLSLKETGVVHGCIARLCESSESKSALSQDHVRPT